MPKPLIKCPKCGCSDLIISVAAEVHFSSLYQNGEFLGHPVEHTSHTIRQFAQCISKGCLHEWVLSEDVELESIPRRNEEQKCNRY